MEINRITWAQIMAHRHKEAHEQDRQSKAWAAEVTEQLNNENSKFLEDFDENQQRIFGVAKCKA